MSKYTTEVRYICESESGILTNDFLQVSVRIGNPKAKGYYERDIMLPYAPFVPTNDTTFNENKTYFFKTDQRGFNNIDNIIALARENIFDFYYPIDEDYKSILESKILRHYYTREICEETVGLWKLRLQDKLNMIMPYYNQLYASAKLKIDPFLDTDITHTNENTSENKSHSTGNNTEINDSTTESNRQDIDSRNSDNIATRKGTDWTLFSDTPQGTIGDISTGGNNENNYLTNATKNTIDERDDSVNRTEGSSESKNSVNNKSNSNRQSTVESGYTNIDNYIEHITGKRSGISYSKLLQEFRETFLNIDKMIIDDLKDCFFALW